MPNMKSKRFRQSISAEPQHIYMKRSNNNEQNHNDITG